VKSFSDNNTQPAAGTHGEPGNGSSLCRFIRRFWIIFRAPHEKEESPTDALRRCINSAARQGYIRECETCFHLGKAYTDVLSIQIEIYHFSFALCVMRGMEFWEHLGLQSTYGEYLIFIYITMNE
jgi:hypothetical protein